MSELVCERCGKPIYKLHGDEITLFNARYRHCEPFPLWTLHHQAFPKQEQAPFGPVEPEMVALELLPCSATNGDFRCGLSFGHEGRAHTARSNDGNSSFSWPNTEAE